MSIQSSITEKSYSNDIASSSVRTNYTQQAQAGANPSDSSLSGSSADNKSCVAVLIDTLKGWLSTLWQLLTSCCKGKDASAANGQLTQAVSGTGVQVSQVPAAATPNTAPVAVTTASSIRRATPLPATAQPTPLLVTISSQPNSFAAQQKRINQEIQQMVTDLVAFYQGQHPGRSTDGLHIYLDFKFQKELRFKQEGFLEVRENTTEFIRLEANPGDLNKFVLDVDVGIVEKGEGDRFKIGKISSRISYDQATDFAIQKSLPNSFPACEKRDLYFFSRDVSQYAISNFIDKVEQDPVV